LKKDGNWFILENRYTTKNHIKHKLTQKQMKQVLLILLCIVAILMIYLGVNSGINPPIFTGIGFVIIAALFLLKNKKD
jgi:uncharacterized membrane protein YbaN (DUF454 family)